MNNLRYKTYTWPHNPTTYAETLQRNPVYALASDGTYVFAGMGGMKRIISGSGAFYGANAYQQFQALMAIAEQAGTGNLIHPIWGTRTCYFTSLEMTQEPRENYIPYRFTFTCVDSEGEIPR